MTKQERKAHKEAWIAEAFGIVELAQAEIAKFPGAFIDIPSQEYWNNYAGGIYGTETR